MGENKKIMDWLSKISDQFAGKQLTPKEGGQCQGLGNAQSTLSQETKTLSDEISELGQKIPMIGGEPQDHVEKAQLEMEGSQEDLNQQQVNPSINHQRDALAELEALQGELNQAKQDMSRGQGRAGLMPFGMQPMGKGVGRQTLNERVLIPGKGNSKETQAWRKSLMKAMKETPPKGYENVTKEYFKVLAR